MRNPITFHVSRFTRTLFPCLLLFALLVPTLDAQSIWWDEGISLHLATSPWRDVITNRAANIHPPLYFFALKVWVGLVGSTPFAARYLSALAATLLPAAAATFLRRRVSARAGRTAALLLALAPPFFIYAQEVRSYAFLPLLMLALLAQVWLPKRGEGRRTKGEGKREEGRGKRAKKKSPIFNLRSSILPAFILTHYAGIIAVGWANVIWLWRCLRRQERQLWRAWLTSAALTALLTLPWVIAVFTVGALGFRKEAGLSNALATPLPLDYFLRLIGIFHTLGLPTAMTAPLLWKPALIVGSLLLLTLAYCVLHTAYSLLPSSLTIHHSPFSRCASVTIHHSAAALPSPFTIQPLRFRCHSPSSRCASVAIHHSPFTIHHSPFAILLLSWLLPLTAAPVIWTLSPQAHPRYLLPFVLPAWLLLATLITSRAVPRMLRGALLAATLMMSILGLRAYLTDPTYARSDQRPIAAFLRESSRPGDVVLLPHTDHALRSYATGAARIVTLPAPTDASAMAAAIADALTPGTRIFTLDYGRGALDPRGQVRALLESYGACIAHHRFGDISLDAYTVYTSTALFTVTPLPAPFCTANAAPCLTGAAIQSQPESGAGLPLALTWSGRLSGATVPPPARYAVALRLYAPSGALVSGIDTLLLDAALCPTELWATFPVTTYHTLPLPPGLTPRAHRLEVGVYAVDAPDVPIALVQANGTPYPAVTLADVSPAIAPWVEDAAYGLPSPTATWDNGLKLWGATVDRPAAYAGQNIFVTLNWRWGQSAPVTPPRLILRQNGRVLTATPALAELPPLPVGRPVLELLALTVPPSAVDGTATLVLLAASQEIMLGEVTLHIDAHTFGAPPIAHPMNVRVGDVATLLGYDLAPTPLGVGVPITLTLIWRAESSATGTDLTVFAHLQSTSGAMLAQHDGKPADWTRPTPGWRPGEIIIDRHILTWQQPMPGPATLRVGLYDAATGTRVPWADGADALLLDGALDISTP